MFNFRLQILGFLAILFIALFGINLTEAKENVIFTYPSKENQVFTRGDKETITGTILTPKELSEGKISFDGMVWRDLTLTKRDDGYDFLYSWTVSGKGRFFILVNATSDDKSIIEGRILAEVYVPPDQEETGLKELLSNYQKEQEKKQAKAKADSEPTKLDTFTTFEFVAEDYIGNFIENDYMALLPTNQQFAYMMNSLVFIYHFIKTYQAGIDIFFLLTMPLTIVLGLGLVLFVIIEYLGEFLDFVFSTWYKTKNKSNNKTAVVFELESRHRVSNARLRLRNSHSGEKFVIAINRNGIADLSVVSDGEYFYELIKNGYKESIIDDFDLSYFQGLPVAKNNSIVISENTLVALPVESQVNLDRKKLNDKASLFFEPKMWFLRNLSSNVTVGSLIMILYMLFINFEIALGGTVFFIICYAIYNLVIKRHANWGRVYNANTGKVICGLKIELYKGDELYETVWTDFDGRYDFEEITDGIYSLRLGEGYKYTEVNGYYHGEEFCVSKNTHCQLKKNIMAYK